MLWIVTPGAVGAAFPGQNPRIIQGISGARHDRMVAARDQDRIPMLDGIRVIERLWIGGIGVDTHEAKALFRLNLEIVDLFHGDFRRRGQAVVFMWRATGPAAGPIQRFAGDEMRGVDIIGDVGEHGARPVVFADLFRNRFAGADVDWFYAGLADRSGNRYLRRAI